MNQDLLQMELRLLLAKYGERRVIGALARLKDSSVESLEAELAKIESNASKRKSRKTPDVAELLASAKSKRPQLAAELERLVSWYESRTFLPELKDVRRFLDRHVTLNSKPKSRAAALPMVLGVLVTLPEPELRRLTEHEPTGASDYSLLANQIMGGRRKERAVKKTG